MLSKHKYDDDLNESAQKFIQIQFKKYNYEFIQIITTTKALKTSNKNKH